MPFSRSEQCRFPARAGGVCQPIRRTRASGRRECRHWQQPTPAALLIFNVHPVVGRDHVEHIEIDSSCTLRVTTTGAGRERLPNDVEALLTYRSTRGREIDSYAARGADGAWTFPSVPVRNASLSLIGVGGAFHTQSIALEDGANELELQLDGDPVRLRVVTAGGEPVPAAYVILRSAARSDWFVRFFADADGYAVAPRCEFDELHAVVHSSTHGSGVGIPVRAARDADDVAQIVLDAECELQLAFVDGSEPLPWMKLFLFDSLASVELRDFIVDQRGEALLERLTRGRYRLVLDQPGIWRKVVDVEVSSKHSKLRVDVRRTGDLELLVVKPGGAPAAGVSLELDSVEFGESVGAWIAAGRVECPSGASVTDAAGRLVLRGLPRGEYRWSIGASSAVVSVPPRAVGRETIELRD